MKQYKLRPEEFRQMIAPMGSGFATDRITVAAARVGYMYREAPDNSIDSGWRFMAGDETQEYADTPDNWAIYDVNDIANLDPAIIPYLSIPQPVEFVRKPGDAAFREVPATEE